MNNFEKCLHVKDATKVAYWRKHDSFTVYDLEDGPLLVFPGRIAVWIASDDGPVMDVIDDAEFNERFVVEGNLPPHMADRLAAAPTYEEWVRSTHATNRGEE